MILIKPHPISSTDAVTQSWGLDRAWTKTSSAHSSPVVFPPCSITSGDLWPPAGALKQGRGSTLPVKNARVVHRTVFIVGCLPLVEDGRKTSWMSVNAANQLLISVYLRPSTHTREAFVWINLTSQKTTTFSGDAMQARLAADSRQWLQLTCQGPNSATLL